MTALDPAGLDAAVRALNMTMDQTARERAEAAVRAYLKADAADLTAELDAERTDHADTMRRAQAAWGVAEDRYRLVERAIGLLEADSFAVSEIDELRDALQRSPAKGERLAGDDHMEHRALRLQGKLSAIAETIGLPLGGGEDGYLIPAIEKLVADRDGARLHRMRLREQEFAGTISTRGPAARVHPDVVRFILTEAADQLAAEARP